MEKNKNLETAMLKKLMSFLPDYATKCSTAQHKTVQHNVHDVPKTFWCCWVTDSNKKKLFAMFDGKNKVKLISENERNSYIIKPIK